MDFGIGIASGVDGWRAAQRAEALGFTHAWFYDTQMLCADVFVSMAPPPLRHRPPSEPNATARCQVAEADVARTPSGVPASLVHLDGGARTGL